MIRVNVLTLFPSPHMMDFWEAVHKSGDIHLRMFIKEPTIPRRSWGRVAECLDTEIAYWSELSAIGRLCWMRKVFSIPADIWILCDSYWSWENHLLAFWARRKRIPTVHHVERIRWEGLRFFDKQSWNWKRIIYRASKKAIVPLILLNFDALACHGTWSVKQYKRIAPSKYIFATEYYVDLDELRKIKRAKKRAGDSVSLVCCGALTLGKGLLYVLHNLKLIDSFPNWQIRIAGDGPLRRDLEAAVPDGLKSRVEFLGNVAAYKMRDFWKDADVLLFPSLYDGWGMVVVEALAAGVPVISGPNVGAARQYIASGHNGIIRDVNHCFLKTIIPILEDPRKINEFSRNARSSVEKYRPEIGAANFIEHLGILTNRE